MIVLIMRTMPLWYLIRINWEKRDLPLSPMILEPERLDVWLDPETVECPKK